MCFSNIKILFIFSVQIELFFGSCIDRWYWWLIFIICLTLLWYMCNIWLFPGLFLLYYCIPDSSHRGTHWADKIRIKQKHIIDKRIFLNKNLTFCQYKQTYFIEISNVWFFKDSICFNSSRSLPFILLQHMNTIPLSSVIAILHDVTTLLTVSWEAGWTEVP